MPNPSRDSSYVLGIQTGGAVNLTGVNSTATNGVVIVAVWSDSGASASGTTAPTCAQTGTFTKASGNFNSTISHTLDIWEATFSSQLSAASINITPPSGASNWRAVAIVIANAAKHDAVTQTVYTSATTMPITQNVTTGTNNALVLGFFESSIGPTSNPAAATGFALDANANGLTTNVLYSIFSAEVASAVTATAGTVVNGGWQTGGSTSPGDAIVVAISLPPGIPAAPSAPTVSSITTTGFQVNPGALTTNATSLNIQVASDSGFGTIVQTVTGATPSANNAVTGLTAGTTYWIRTVAVNGAGSTNGASTSNPTLCNAPSGLTVSAVGGNTTNMSLSWLSTTGATSYNVLRSTTNGSGYATFSGSTGINTNSFTDTTAPTGVNVYYVVQAVDGSGASANSSQGTGTTLVPSSAPTGITATPTVGNPTPSVTLSWSAATGAASYNVYRSLTAGSGYAKIGSTTGTTYVDSTVANGTTYYYEISSVNGTAEGPLSGTTGPELPQVCPPPTGLTATYQAGVGINLAWTAPVGFTGTGYNIYRVSNASTNGQGHKLQNQRPYAQVPWGTTSFTDKLMGYPPVTTGANVFVYYITSVLLNAESVAVQGAPTGGSYTLMVTVGANGTPQATGAIAYNASAAAVAAAIAALSNVGAGNIQVYAPANGGPYLISGANFLHNTPIIVALGSNSLTGGTSPTVQVTHYQNGTLESVASNIPGAVTFSG